MSLFEKLEILEPSPCLFTSPFDFPLPHEEHKLSFPLHLFEPIPISSPFAVFDSFLDITHIERTPFSSAFRRIRSTPWLDSSLSLRRLSLYDPFTALDLAFGPVTEADRKYTSTAEIKCPERKQLHRSYNFKAGIRDSENHSVDRKYKLTVEIDGGKPDKCIDTIKEKPKNVGIKIKEPESAIIKKKSRGVRVVEIEEPVDQATIFLRQAFSKRAGAIAKAKGKAKEMSPQDAALVIQISFRAYIIRRSQALRSLRELAVSKSKLKEIRVLFNNTSYRRRITRDAEERNRFTERIIALLLAVDAIQGADLMVRAARRSMLDELEAMLDVVDPQPPGKLGLAKGRKFDF